LNINENDRLAIDMTNYVKESVERIEKRKLKEKRAHDKYYLELLNIELKQTKEKISKLNNKISS